VGIPRDRVRIDDKENSTRRACPQDCGGNNGAGSVDGGERSLSIKVLKCLS
jgi:hypothetical protein